MKRQAGKALVVRSVRTADHAPVAAVRDRVHVDPDADILEVRKIRRVVLIERGVRNEARLETDAVLATRVAGLVEKPARRGGIRTPP